MPQQIITNNSFHTGINILKKLNLKCSKARHYNIKLIEKFKRRSGQLRKMEPSAFSEQPNPGHRRRRNWGGTDLNFQMSAICQHCVMRAPAVCQRCHSWILISGQDSLIHPKNVVMFDKMKELIFWFSQHTLDDIILLPPWVWAGSGPNLELEVCSINTHKLLLKMIISDLFRILLLAVCWGQRWKTFSVRIPLAA